MNRNAIKDPEYVAWVRTLPCIKCGHVSKGRNHYDEPYHNAFHHVNGRDNDHSGVPLCDRTVSSPGHSDCHHRHIHKNMRYWRKILTKKAEMLYDRYCKEVLDEDMSGTE